MPDGERITLEPAARIAQRRAEPAPTAAPRDVHAPLLRLQRTHGNRFVARMLARAAEEGGATLTPEVEEEIERERGGGGPLAGEVRTKLEGALGADLSGVRVHTGPRADGLSRALNALAFTTGSDVFFRAGAYDPGSSAGRELLAHELTHVVQQGDEPVRRKLELGPAADEYEREADDVASSVVQRWDEVPDTLRRQALPEEDEEPVRMQPVAGRIGRRIQRTRAGCDHGAGAGKSTGRSERQRAGGDVARASRSSHDVAAGLLDLPPPAIDRVHRADDLVRRRISYLERMPATPELLGHIDAAIADIEVTLTGASGLEVDELREGVAALRALRERDAITFWIISGGLTYASYDNASGELRLHVNPEFGRRAFVPSRLVHEAIHAVHAGRYPRLARAYGEVLAAGGTSDERLGVVLLQWKAWTEYWAYRRAVEYENLRRGDELRLDPHRAALEERDVRASIGAVRAETGREFEPWTWTPPRTLPARRR